MFIDVNKNKYLILLMIIIIIVSVFIFFISNSDNEKEDDSIVVDDYYVKNSTPDVDTDQIDNDFGDWIYVENFDLLNDYLFEDEVDVLNKKIFDYIQIYINPYILSGELLRESISNDITDLAFVIKLDNDIELQLNIQLSDTRNIENIRITQ